MNLRLGGMVRRILPAGIRREVGCRLLNMAARNTRSLRLYVRLLHGYSVPELRTRYGRVEYRYKDYVLLSPTDGVGSFLEVFKESVYDAVFSPREGEIVVDVGAYVGMWTVRAALSVGKEGRVLALEPVRANREYLTTNTLGLVPVTVLPYVVSDRDGAEDLYIPTATAGSSTVLVRGERQTLPCRTLDTLLARLTKGKADFIKIDAEGAELKVLQGAERTLAQNARIKLSIASYRDLSNGVPRAEALSAFLEARGFRTQTRSGLRRYVYAWKTD